jgi:hypothetical protein
MRYEEELMDIGVQHERSRIVKLIKEKVAYIVLLEEDEQGDIITVEPEGIIDYLWRSA